MPFRDDRDALLGRIRELEKENVDLRLELDHRGHLTDFATVEQVERLEEENRVLHQKLILLEQEAPSGLNHTLAVVSTQALVLQGATLQKNLLAVRTDLQTFRVAAIILVIAWWLMRLVA